MGILLWKNNKCREKQRNIASVMAATILIFSMCACFFFLCAVKEGLTSMESLNNRLCSTYFLLLLFFSTFNCHIWNRNSLISVNQCNYCSRCLTSVFCVRKQLLSNMIVIIQEALINSEYQNHKQFINKSGQPWDKPHLTPSITLVKTMKLNN